MNTINVCLVIGLIATVGMLVILIMDKNRIRKGKGSFILEDDNEEGNDE